MLLKRQGGPLFVIEEGGGGFGSEGFPSGIFVQRPKGLGVFFFFLLFLGVAQAD